MKVTFCGLLNYLVSVSNPNRGETPTMNTHQITANTVHVHIATVTHTHTQTVTGLICDGLINPMCDYTLASTWAHYLATTIV
jgi:hypothetical protein